MNNMRGKPWSIFLLISLGLGSGCSQLAGSGETTTIDQTMLLKQLESAQKPLIIDVRTPQEYGEGHLPSAINIPHTEIAARLGEITAHKDQPVVLYCKTGRRAAIAAATLQQAGFTRLRHLEGDMEEWKAKGLPQER